MVNGFTLTGIFWAAGFGFFKVFEGYSLWGASALLGWCIFAGVAALVLASPETRESWLKPHLSAPAYAPMYRATLRPVLNWALRLVDQPQPEGDSRVWRKVLRDTWTYRLQDRAVLFAVAYPVVLLLIRWGAGHDASLGSVTIIEAEPEWLRRLATLAPLASFPLFLFLRNKAAAHQKQVVRDISAVLFFGPFFLLALLDQVFDLDPVAFAGVLAVVFAGALGLAGAGAVAFAGAVAAALAGAVALALAVALAFAVAVAGAVERGHTGLASWLLWALPATAITALCLLVPWAALPAERTFAITVFAFLAILPLTNALFDSLSYLVTLTLAQVGLNRPRLAVPLALLDMVFAAVLFLGLGAALVCVLAMANAASGVVFVDLASLLPAIGDWKTYWWVWAMAFSTAVPTAVHLATAALSIQVWLPGRGFILKQFDRLDEPLSALLAAGALGTLWAASLALGCGLIFGLGYALWTHGLSEFLTAYQQWLIAIADRVGAFSQPM